MTAVQLFTLIIIGMVSPLLATDVDLGFRYRLTPCPTFSTGNALNETEFLGTWNEIKRTSFLFEDNTKCVTTKYFERGSGGFFLAYGRIIFWPISFEKTTRIRLRPRMDESYESEIKVQNTWISLGNIRVLYTDYTDIAVTYSCRDLFYGTAVEQAWIVSRTTAALTSNQEATVTTALTPTGLLLSEFQAVDNTNCGR
ncbi:uncharacterized protein LOC110455775 [Mizuhopecten yessoensis]|uniref:Apolipoprotein D n=1 Tax=Mizuhopecten yessoensis TaxID=6573 RepID=A0A210QCB3_MIZYE|nr:uncharacterized protein LOC110455775 [Mizuhopecten yessoensis]OWF46396.1 hypothetical protein KP79_PYT09320 [Mizuhopecten yessoensis]